MDDFFPFLKKIGFLAILGPPYRGIGATIPIGFVSRMQDFFVVNLDKNLTITSNLTKHFLILVNGSKCSLPPSSIQDQLVILHFLSLSPAQPRNSKLFEPMPSQALFS